jgi:hypothetical protein
MEDCTDAPSTLSRRATNVPVAAKRRKAFTSTSPSMMRRGELRPKRAAQSSI